MVVVVDPGDIRKKHTLSMEYLCKVHEEAMMPFFYY